MSTGYFDPNMNLSAYLYLSMNIQILTLIRMICLLFGHYPVSGYNGFLYDYMTPEHVLAQRRP